MYRQQIWARSPPTLLYSQETQRSKQHNSLRTFEWNAVNKNQLLLHSPSTMIGWVPAEVHMHQDRDTYSVWSSVNTPMDAHAKIVLLVVVWRWWWWWRGWMDALRNTVVQFARQPKLNDKEKQLKFVDFGVCVMVIIRRSQSFSQFNNSTTTSWLCFACACMQRIQTHSNQPKQFN